MGNNQEKMSDLLKKYQLNQKPLSDKDHRGRTPFMIALENGNKDAVQKVPLKQRDIDGNNIFHIACQSVNPGDMFLHLLKTFKNITKEMQEKNIFGETPMHILTKQDN